MQFVHVIQGFALQEVPQRYVDWVDYDKAVIVYNIPPSEWGVMHPGGTQPHVGPANAADEFQRHSCSLQQFCYAFLVALL